MDCAKQMLQTLEFDKIREQIADRCASTLGRGEIEALIPTDDPDLIAVRLRPVLECMNLIAFGDPISLHNIPDIRRALSASTTPGALLSITELLHIVDILSNSRILHAYMADRREKYPELWVLSSRLTPAPDLEKTLQNALDPGTEAVRDSASTELRRIRRAIGNLRSRIREQVEKVLAKLPDTIVQDRLVTLRGDRFVIPIKENQKSKVPGLVHDQSSSGATLFIEPMVTVELNNQLRSEELAERREIERILRELTAQVAQIAEPLHENLLILGQFDAIYAKASYGRDLDCTEPIFGPNIVLRNARHPLLISRLRSENAIDELVPLNLTMADDFSTLILTGPNAGGKTVTLKTLGLLALIAQAGLPIPADEKTELPIFSGIFADIGDAQSIENDLSTFSSHVSNLIAINNNADWNALILLDEVGASTDPDEGSALAVALLNAFTQRGCRTLATTHHGALKAVAHSTPGMANGSMAFDTENLTPTFHLRVGVPGSSYAFEIASRLGMDQTIIAEARNIAGTDVRRVESLILDLDAAYQRQREAVREAEKNQTEMETLKADYEIRLADVEQRERELNHGAREEAQKIMANANALVERTVRELRESQASKTSIRQAHKNIEKARQDLAQKLSKPAIDQKTTKFEIGDRVFSHTLNSEGIVVTPPNNAGRILVEIGNLKVELAPTDLILCENAKNQPSTDKITRNKLAHNDIPIELDVRGQTFDEASDVVDRYLDDLVMAHRDQARIIHGKGTGALKQKLSDYFKTHPHVKSQRSGKQGEGDWGVTVVTLHTS